MTVTRKQLLSVIKQLNKNMRVKGNPIISASNEILIDIKELEKYMNGLIILEKLNQISNFHWTPLRRKK